MEDNIDEKIALLESEIQEKEEKLKVMKKKYSSEKEKRIELESLCGIIDSMFKKLKDEHDTFKLRFKSLQFKKTNDFKYCLDKVISGCVYDSMKNGSICSVCQYGFTEPEELTLVLNCFHCYHKECIKGCIGTTHKCPDCGDDLNNLHNYGSYKM